MQALANTSWHLIAYFERGVQAGRLRVEMDKGRMKVTPIFWESFAGLWKMLGEAGFVLSSDVVEGELIKWTKKLRTN